MMKRPLPVLFALSALSALLTVSACNSATRSMTNSSTTDSSATDREYYSAPGTEGLDLPFSAAVRAGNTIYLSGNVGNVPGKLQLVEGGLLAETRQTLENIKNTLEVAGATMDDIVKCTVFIQDMSRWPEMNGIYKTFFDNPPARSAVGASGLALNAAIEIDCIAVIG
jgi:2-iminobutanoate/2-iminopropanoate deaminase